MLSKQYYLILLILYEVNALIPMKSLEKKLKGIKARSMTMYGNITGKTTNVWEFEVENPLHYPYGDKGKLAQLSLDWNNYYECLLRQTELLGVNGAMPSQYIMEYLGFSVYMKCSICLSPEGKESFEWWYSKPNKTPTFSMVSYKENIVVSEYGDLIIFHIDIDDSGLYFCKLGESQGTQFVLQVVDHEEEFNVVKPMKARNGPHSKSNSKLYNKLEVFSRWTKWTPCSNCDIVGRRRKVGMCYIKLINESHGVNHSAHSKQVKLDKGLIKLFNQFPDGVPCRSKLLPISVRNNQLVAKRKSEIMIGLCKRPCIEIQDEMSSGSFKNLLDLPPEPPPPERDILFLRTGQYAAILCPGEPVKWKVGTMVVIPMELNKQSKGRLYISARDEYVISSAKVYDSELYSCWQEDKLAGSVKVIVSSKSIVQVDHHITLFGILVVMAITLRVMLRTLGNKRKRISLK